MRNNLITAAVAIGVAVLTAYGTMLMSLNSKMFEAQASMVTQEQLRFELEQSNNRVEHRLNGIEEILLILLERDRAPVQ